MSKIVNPVYSLMQLKPSEIKDFNNLKDLPWLKFYQSTSKNCLRCGVTMMDGCCQSCCELGVVTCNTIFYQLAYIKHKKGFKRLNQTLKLTNLQASASLDICDAITTKQDILIWAVCGAGKTEICFDAIKATISKESYVCFAIPRIDVLYDVYERLKEYFDTTVIVLNSKEPKLQYGQIYVMTTNQLLKFKNCFDLIIVDEVDAFPYEHEPKFENAVSLAKTKNAITVYLTSTPSEQIKNKVKRHFIIYERWHGFDLPVPKLLYYNVNKFKAGIVPVFLYLFLKHSKRQKLLFISNRFLAEKIARILDHALTKKTVKSVHSMDEMRLTKIADFKSNKIDILVTTTILERGVTFKDCDVVILDTSSYLYNKAALIQIAGRVGRNINFQQGQVYFCYQKMTNTIKEAVAEIKLMNSMKKIPQKDNTQN